MMIGQIEIGLAVVVLNPTNQQPRNNQARHHLSNQKTAYLQRSLMTLLQPNQSQTGG